MDARGTRGRCPKFALRHVATLAPTMPQRALRSTLVCTCALVDDAHRRSARPFERVAATHTRAQHMRRLRSSSAAASAASTLLRCLTLRANGSLLSHPSRCLPRQLRGSLPRSGAAWRFRVILPTFQASLQSSKTITSLLWSPQLEALVETYGLSLPRRLYVWAVHPSCCLTAHSKPLSLSRGSCSGKSCHGRRACGGGYGPSSAECNGRRLIDLRVKVS